MVHHTADVHVAVHILLEGVFIQYFVAVHAVARPQHFFVAQILHVRRGVGGVDIFVFQVALDLVVADEAADDAVAAGEQTADKIDGFLAVGLFDFAQAGIEAVDNLAAVAAGSAPADACAFENHHLMAGFEQVQGGRQGAVTAADNTDFGLDVVFQRGVFGLLVAAGGIIAAGITAVGIGRYIARIAVHTVSFAGEAG